MSQESGNRRRRDPVDEVTPDTFDRLDALSRPLAERVLQRAIELHHDQVHGPDRITRTQLDQIANELGIEPEFVRMALVDELQAHRGQSARSVRERILAPDRITAGRIVESDQESTERSIVQWLRGAEGFRPRAKTGSGYVWERDDRWSTKLRIGLQSQPGSLRGLRNVTHRHTDLGDGRQLVELDADARIVSNTGGGIIAGFGTLSVLAGIASAVGNAGGNDIAQFLAAMVPTAGLGVGVGLITAKAWAANIRNGVNRALDGISSPELYQHSRKGRRKSGLAKVLDDLGDAIEDVFD